MPYPQKSHSFIINNIGIHRSRLNHPFSSSSVCFVYLIRLFSEPISRLKDLRYQHWRQTTKSLWKGKKRNSKTEPLVEGAKCLPGCMYSAMLLLLLLGHCWLFMLLIFKDFILPFYVSSYLLFERSFTIVSSRLKNSKITSLFYSLLTQPWIKICVYGNYGYGSLVQECIPESNYIL